MVLTSPQAYNFNCAPQSSQYLYNIVFLLFQAISQNVVLRHRQVFPDRITYYTKASLAID